MFLGTRTQKQTWHSLLVTGTRQKGPCGKFHRKDTRQESSNFTASNLPRGFVQKVAGLLFFRVSGSLGLWGGLRICMSNNLPDDAEAAGYLSSQSFSYLQ